MLFLLSENSNKINLIKIKKIFSIKDDIEKGIVFFIVEKIKYILKNLNFREIYLFAK